MKTLSETCDRVIKQKSDYDDNYDNIGLSPLQQMGMQAHTSQKIYTASSNEKRLNHFIFSVKHECFQIPLQDSRNKCRMYAVLL